MEGIDRVLEQIGAIDPVTGIEITADNVFLDWVLASYLMNENVSDGRYIYKIFPNAPQAEETESRFGNVVERAKLGGSPDRNSLQLG